MTFASFVFFGFFPLAAYLVLGSSGSMDPRQTLGGGWVDDVMGHSREGGGAGLVGVTGCDVAGRGWDQSVI